MFWRRVFVGWCSIQPILPCSKTLGSTVPQQKALQAPQSTLDEEKTETQGHQSRSPLQQREEGNSFKRRIGRQIYLVSANVPSCLDFCYK